MCQPSLLMTELMYILEGTLCVLVLMPSEEEAPPATDLPLEASALTTLKDTPLDET
jgi:hypothetical protein